MIKQAKTDKTIDISDAMARAAKARTEKNSHYSRSFHRSRSDTLDRSAKSTESAKSERSSYKGEESSGYTQEKIRLCDAQDCDNHGVYKAPKSPETLGESYYYFCLKHVRDYNQSWDYFINHSVDDLEKFHDNWGIGDRTTKPIFNQHQRLTKMAFEQLRTIFGPDHTFWNRFNEKESAFHDRGAEYASFFESSRWNEQEKQALKVLLLDVNASIKDVKSQYKILVKKYHPDTQIKDKEFFQEKLKRINHAYAILSSKINSIDKAQSGAMS